MLVQLQIKADYSGRKGGEFEQGREVRPLGVAQKLERVFKKKTFVEEKLAAKDETEDQMSYKTSFNECQVPLLN